MSCKWMFCFTLSTAIAGSFAIPSFAQYQPYPSTPAYGASGYSTPDYSAPAYPMPALPSAQSPRGTSLLPPVTHTQPAPNVSPFADIHSRLPQPSMPRGNGETSQFYAAPQRYPAPQSYYTYATSTPTSLSESPREPVGSGTPYGAPAYAAPGYSAPGYPAAGQSLTPTPQSNSYYDHPAQDYWSQSAYGLDVKGAGCSTGVAPCHSGWYGGVYGLVMTRSRANNLWLSYDQTDIRDRVLNSNDANFSTAGGAGVNVGHYFNCGQNSLQFIYWGLYPGSSEANAYGANTAVGIDTILHFDGLQYDAGTGAQNLSGTFFFNAERHRVQRSYDVQNIELNLLGHNFTAGCCPLKLGWTAGVRYLRFDEDFLYSSDAADPVFTGAPEEVHYAIDTKNNLVGFQLGGQANYCVGPRLNLFTTTKVGVYGNHMSQHSQIYGSNGSAFVGDAASPYFGEDVNATSSKNGYSMIGDLSVGANWCINPCWSVNVGYRAVGVTGVALSTNQVPVDFIGALDSIRTVNSNGCLLLHGAFAGINFCY